jgi:hypothetical protein
MDQWSGLSTETVAKAGNCLIQRHATTLADEGLYSVLREKSCIVRVQSLGEVSPLFISRHSK